MISQFIKEENDDSFDSMFEDELVTLLKSFDLYEELYSFLTGKNMNIEGLKYIQRHHMDKLFEGFDNLNTRIIFEHKLGIWQRTQGIFYLTLETAPTNHSVASWIRETNSFIHSPSLKSDIPESDIGALNILNKTEQGKALIAKYEKNKCLNPEDRTYIVRIIIQHFIENNKNLSVKECAKLSEQIVNIFPSEQKETYFVAGVNKGPPKGKLYDRYRGQKRAIKRKLDEDEYPSTSKHKQERHVKDFEEEDINKDSLSEPELISICNQLKHNRNWDTVQKQWIQTLRMRQNMIQNNKDPSLQQIFSDWPLYKDCKAQELIEIDYNFLRPGKTFKFEKWDLFCRHALDFFEKRIKTDFLKIYLKQFREKYNLLDMDSINIAVMTLLHGILPPAARIFQGKLKRFTIIESLSAFTLESKKTADIESLLNQRREECFKNKMILQPLIIVVGEKCHYQEFFVTIDNVKYKMTSYLECIDFVFKISQVLNIEYPPQCFSVWRFIQKFLFEIDEGDIIPSVQTVLNDIQQHLSLK